MSGVYLLGYYRGILTRLLHLTGNSPNHKIAGALFYWSPLSNIPFTLFSDWTLHRYWYLEIIKRYVAQVKQLEVALKESKERGIEDRQRMQKEIEQMKSWTRLRKQPVQKTSAHIGNFI